jgi:hypothetical protein
MSLATYWCYTGSKITWKYSEPHQSSPGSYWDAKGSDSSGSTGNNPWIRYYHVEFKHCVHVPVVDQDICNGEANPWIRHTMTKAGGYAVDSDVHL